MLIESFLAYDDEGTKHVLSRWQYPSLNVGNRNLPKESLYCLATGQVARKVEEGVFEFVSNGVVVRLRKGDL